MSRIDNDKANRNLNYSENNEYPLPMMEYLSQNTSLPSINMSYDHSKSAIDNIPITDTIMTLEIRENDRKIIGLFIKEYEELLETERHHRTRMQSMISGARSALLSICKLNYEVRVSRDDLERNKDIPDTAWQEKTAQIQDKRDTILKHLNKLKQDQFLSEVKKNIEKRKKRRVRESRKRAHRKNNKLAAVQRRTDLHAKADAWITDKQSILEREKQVSAMRKDADVVLAEVRSRRGDARKSLALLEELRNLRKIRLNIARARGEYLSAAADESFNNIIDRLVEKWTTMDREYSIEEQGLKLMLKTDNEKRLEKQTKSMFDEWEIALFGRKLLHVDTFQRSIASFVTKRAAWDRYISRDGLGSSLPIGWIIPDQSSSTAWQQYLRKG